MGTTWSVKFGEGGSGERPVESTKATLHARLQEVLDEVNQSMSTYLPDSELSRLNDAAPDEVFHVTGDLLAVIVRAEEIASDSDGAFDPTVAPLVDLWGFGPKQATPELPSDDQIREAQALVGWWKLRVDREESTVVKTDEGVRVDLSAIAKGFAVDRLAEELLSSGHTDFLVEVGGELRVQGFRDRIRESLWTVGIEAPDSTVMAPRAHRILTLRSGALATSGDYRNYYERDGKRYSHTIDPRTGKPVEHRGASVTVHARDCASADGLATALLVLGPDQGFAWAERQGLTALFLVYNDDGTVDERRTPGMVALLADSEAH